MKVLFAVSNEEISESIVKRYQRDYKEIISYKNVYYFNAILKELQKDKTYDRIVISEDLEAFTNTQYDQIDKFIFDKLDSISDEASNIRGEDIPIILICTDRREKSEQMLVKIFGIGIYNALLGNDRSIQNVCSLLNKPRLKKDAKAYYKIDSEDVGYQSENENDVSEMEIQNILAHYKRLGKDEKKYVESFDNIASQYNDVQLRIISKFLPLNVRAVLEEQSAKYQQIISYNSKVSDNLRGSKNVSKEKQTTGTMGKLLSDPNKEKILSKPVVIPSSVNMTGIKKLAKTPVLQENSEMSMQDDEKQIEKVVMKKTQPNNDSLVNKNIETNIVKQEIYDRNVEKEIEDENIEQEVVEKKRRGRPRKTPVEQEEIENKPKRGRGRPRKNQVPEEQEKMVLPGLENQTTETNSLPGFEEEEDDTDNILPGFTDIEGIDEEPKDTNPKADEEQSNILPGFEENDEEDDENNIDSILPGFEKTQEDVPVNDNYSKSYSNHDQYQYNNQDNSSQHEINQISYNEEAQNNRNEIANTYQDVDISNLLTTGKKVACFVGTSKNGTSFIINNLAQMTSSMGIDTAILDTTKNRNSYYIYTKNEEDLRKIAMNNIQNLLQGTAKGIDTGKNLSVYTSLPDETEGIENAGLILQTLLKKHSLVLIDCDFDTPISYFEKAQEIYLVQSFDVLTIQPLTAFLRDLKSKNVLNENKLRAVLNKEVKLRGVNDKTIIGGMAYYNDPSMSFMTELFNKNTIRYITVPFDEIVYQKYLESLINCEVSIKGYPKNIVQVFQRLANMVYPLVSGKSTYTPPRVQSNTFTPSMNSTLDQMKMKY